MSDLDGETWASIRDPREKIRRLAQVDPQLAVEKARTIQDPWIRCQSLSSVAEYATLTRDERVSIVREALLSADECKDPNRIVTVASWPLEVLCGGEDELLAKEVDRMLLVAAKESHPTRRGDALFTLYTMLHRAKGPDGCLRKILGAFKEACKAGHGWKRDRNLKDLAEMLATFDREESVALVELIEKPQIRRAAYQKLGKMKK